MVIKVAEKENLRRSKIGKSRLMRLHRKHAHTTNTTFESSKEISLRSADPLRSASSFDNFSTGRLHTHHGKRNRPPKPRPTGNHILRLFLLHPDRHLPRALRRPLGALRDQSHHFHRRYRAIRCCKDNLRRSAVGHPLRLLTVAPGDEG